MDASCRHSRGMKTRFSIVVSAILLALFVPLYRAEAPHLAKLI